MATPWKDDAQPLLGRARTNPTFRKAL